MNRTLKSGLICGVAIAFALSCADAPIETQAKTPSEAFGRPESTTLGRSAA